MRESMWDEAYYSTNQREFAAIRTNTPNASPLTIHEFKSSILSPPRPFLSAIKSAYFKQPLPSLAISISSYLSTHSPSVIASQSCLCAGSGRTERPTFDLARCSGLKSNRRNRMKSTVVVLRFDSTSNHSFQSGRRPSISALQTNLHCWAWIAIS